MTTPVQKLALKRNLFFLFVLMGMLFELPAMAGLGQCGGEGPTPISDERVTPRYQSISTMGSVLEYAVSDSTNEIFYRTDAKELYRTTIGSTTSTKITDAPYPLSRVLHKSGSYLVTEPDGHFWNIGASTKWNAMTLKMEPVQPIFWDGDDLYLLGEEDDPTGVPSYQMRRYKAGYTTSTRHCGYIPARSWGYEIASGHSFPYMYFYKMGGTIGANRLSLYRFDLRSCVMSKIVTYASRLPGNVHWVHWFAGSNTVAVSTDHPTKNLLYDQGNGICHYFDLGGEEPLITNPRVPAVVVVRGANQAELLHLQTGKKNDLSTNTNYYNNVRWSDFYLTNDSKTLFVAPQSAGTRDLVQVRVKP